MLGKHVGKLLEGCSWVGIPFGGGMSELPHISARTIVVGDKHKAIINLARVVRSYPAKEELVRELNTMLFHPDDLQRAQDRCKEIERLAAEDKRFIGYDWPHDTHWARDYFVSSWMARNGTAGTDDEFDAGLSLRYDAGGGDSVVRFRNAVEGLHQWHELAQRCTFTTDDCFEFLSKCKDEPEHGIYCDAPWPDDGDKYKCAFSEEDQRCLAAALLKFKNARVIVRYGDHPLIRELYPEDIWEWSHLDGRTAANKKKKEVLLVKRRSTA